MEPDTNREPTLCLPDSNKSCFSCCPPIRPSGYEHIQYAHSIKRVLRENTRDFPKKGSSIIPITGFSCWALGYLDREYKLVGCLLHPVMNKGEDQRYRVSFGEKCRRETCPEAKVFSSLGIRQKRFWLSLASGLDSFQYSSRAWNPLFRIMGWGPDLLMKISSKETGRLFSKEDFWGSYPLLLFCSNPKAWAYPVNRLVNTWGVEILKSETFGEHLERIVARLGEELVSAGPGHSGDPPVHLLGLDSSFLDFLRLSAGISRIREDRAKELQEKTDKTLLEMSPTSSF